MDSKKKTSEPEEKSAKVWERTIPFSLSSWGAYSGIFFGNVGIHEQCNISDVFALFSSFYVRERGIERYSRYESKEDVYFQTANLVKNYN
jgi:hypothetical protein